MKVSFPKRERKNDMRILPVTEPINNYIILNGAVFRLERILDPAAILEIPTHERMKHNEESVLSVCLDGKLNTYTLIVHGSKHSCECETRKASEERTTREAAPASRYLVGAGRS